MALESESEKTRPRYRWNLPSTDFLGYIPPKVILYTGMQARYYCLWFVILIIAQILSIMVLKSYASSEFQNLNGFEKLLHCTVSSNFPFSTRDWDFKNDGGPDEHNARKEEKSFEVTVNIFINWFFNTLLLSPMIYLCKYYLRKFKNG